MPEPARHLSEAEIRREAARRAFWSSHPLVDAFRRARAVDDVRLKELIAFVETMPQPEFNACMFSAGVRR